jgi:hypothetical protein
MYEKCQKKCNKSVSNYENDAKREYDEYASSCIMDRVDRRCPKVGEGGKVVDLLAVILHQKSRAQAMIVLWLGLN